MRVARCIKGSLKNTNAACCMYYIKLSVAITFFAKRSGKVGWIANFLHLYATSVWIFYKILILETLGIGLREDKPS